MKLLLLIVFQVLLPHQASISFNDLEKKPNVEGFPVYHYKGQPFTGTTIDSAHYEQKVIHHHVQNGLIQKQLGWDYQGNLVRSFEYKNGILHGRVLLFFSNGQKYLEENYQNGMIEGEAFGWYQDGSRRFIAEYFGGVEISRYEYPKPEPKD